MNSPYRMKAAKRSPVDSLVAGEPKAAPARKGPSLFFSVSVIAAVAVMTAGGVAVFFAEPSQGAADVVPVAVAEMPAVAKPIEVEKPVMTASLDPTFPPVRKVVTTQVAALKAPAIDLPAPQPPRKQSVVETTDPLQYAAAAEFDALEQQDPRWARLGVEQSNAAFASVLQPGAANGEPTDDETADNADDETRTAAIAPDEAKPSRKAKSKQTDDDAVTDVPAGVGDAARSASVRKGANMRSRPKSGSSVLMVVPSRAVVQVVSCKIWCEVIYQGRRGYIYKDFIGGASKRSASSKATKAKKVAAASQPKTKTVYTVDTVEKPKVEEPKRQPLTSDHSR